MFALNIFILTAVPFILGFKFAEEWGEIILSVIGASSAALLAVIIVTWLSTKSNEGGLIVLAFLIGAPTAACCAFIGAAFGKLRNSDNSSDT